MSLEASVDSEVLKDGRLIIHRAYFAKLLAFPKPLRDQLVLELPILEAFRAGEVSSLRVEDVDFENGDLRILDSKKHKHFLIPLDPVLAVHADEYMRLTGRTQGILIQPLPGAPHTGRKPGSKTLGAGLSVKTIEYIWANNCERAGVPVMSPRVGRAYFAAKWHFIERKSLYGLMMILRHTDLQVTVRYISRLCDYLTVKNEFYQGEDSPFSSGCARAESCPVSCEDCHCKFYQARVEVQSAQNAAPLLRSP